MTTTTDDYSNSLELKCINSIRTFSADMPQAAKSGHPGAPMGMAPIAHLLFTEIMKYSPSNPKWFNRDRFVLSNGHACALLYTMLHLTGYNLSIEDCMKFRKIGSKTPGHPENFMTEGVEVSTGPLGQGLSNAVGLAIAEKHLSTVYNTPEYSVFDNYTYVLCGDGCLQEGVTSEACSLAGHLGLGKLILFYDDNNITIDGPTGLSFTEDVGKRFEAYGWHVQSVDDVTNGLSALKEAVTNAKNVTHQPSIIKVRTTIGYGSEKEGTAKTHGAPLGEDDLANVKSKFGFDPTKKFNISDDVRDFYKAYVAKCEKKRDAWDDMFAKYKLNYPDKCAEIERRFRHELISDLSDKYPTEAQCLATRKHSNIVLNEIAPFLPELMGGSADLTPSNLTALKCSGDFQKDTPEGRYLRFGVREHGMAAICNGLFAYGGFRPYCATFLNFTGYALGAVRISALSKFGVIYIMTHDSIGLGEDGPTHQPVETLQIIRSMPNIYAFRPADGNETAAAYDVALKSVETPTVICLSRTTLPALQHSSFQKACKGAYVLEDSPSPSLIIVASGSEVGISVEASEVLNASGISTRVVSMPCQDIFLQQSQEYQTSVLPGDVPTLSVEASSVFGWYRFSHGQIGLNRFGLSGNYKDVFNAFGFTTDNVIAKGRLLVEYYKDRPVPKLNDRPTFQSFNEELHH